MWSDAVDPVVLHLASAAIFGDFQQIADASGNLVGKKDHLTVHMAGGTSRSLDQGCAATQEPLLVGIQYADKAYLGKVESLA